MSSQESGSPVLASAHRAFRVVGALTVAFGVVLPVALAAAPADTEMPMLILGMFGLGLLLVVGGWAMMRGAIAGASMNAIVLIGGAVIVLAFGDRSYVQCIVAVLAPGLAAWTSYAMSMAMMSVRHEGENRWQRIWGR